ncbi:uncharacterized protein [Dermacentor albipictus]|uniref:uncharacterized protein isoform X3 n=2 Tax=Dermacentor albipictus TaxID=60249 RepID=UPI0031FBF286
MLWHSKGRCLSGDKKRSKASSHRSSTDFDVTCSPAHRFRALHDCLSVLTSGDDEDSDFKVAIIALIFCIMFMAVLALIVFVLAGGSSNDEDEDAVNATSRNATSGVTVPGVKPANNLPPPPVRATLPHEPLEEATTPAESSTLERTDFTEPHHDLPSTPRATPRVFTTAERTQYLLTTAPATQPTTTKPTAQRTAAPTTRPTTKPITKPHALPTGSTTPPVKEIVCTLSHSAVTESMYPPDKYCDYLYYCEVVLSEHELHGAVDDVSWALFQKKAARRTYRRVKVGVAFDYRYITARMLDGARAALAGLSQKNIKHYGLLNVVVSLGELVSTVTALKSVLEKLKFMPGNVTERKIIMAIGLYDYSEGNAWKTYKDVVKNVVDTYKVDTVIAISSAVQARSESECYAVPPTALYSPNPKFIGLMNQSELVAPWYPYENQMAVVGLSLELGTLLYYLRNDAQTEQDIPYAPCVDASMTSLDVLCAHGQSTPISRDGNPVAVAGYASTPSKKKVFLAEILSTFSNKYQRMATGAGFRNRMAWLLYNVHLGDHTRDCTGPFDALAKVCQQIKDRSSC